MPPEFLAIFLDDDVPEPNAFLGIEEDVEDGGDGHEVPDPDWLYGGAGTDIQTIGKVGPAPITTVDGLNITIKGAGKRRVPKRVYTGRGNTERVQKPYEKRSRVGQVVCTASRVRDGAWCGSIHDAEADPLGNWGARNWMVQVNYARGSKPPVDGDSGGPAYRPNRGGIKPVGLSAQSTGGRSVLLESWYNIRFNNWPFLRVKRGW
jgi:hypothetical protein